MTETTPVTIHARDRDPVLRAARAGVVPARGQYLIQVGRKRELEQLICDLDVVADGGAAFRIFEAEFGGGKTFLLNLGCDVARQRGLVTVHADLTPGHRLHATNGEARALYGRLVASMATRSKPDGGALVSVVEKFVGGARDEAATRGVPADVVIRERLSSLRELPRGYDFAEVVAQYWRGHDTGDDELRSNAIRWLRGEFATRTDARNALGVRSYVDDAAFFDQLKLLARFTRLAGYRGLLVVLDEMVNLLKLGNGPSRRANYELILHMLSDCLQGGVSGLGFVLGGTPEFVMDPRKGLFSYGALATRLAGNSFAKDGLVDLSGPVIRLAALTPEDLVVLLFRIRHVHAWGDSSKYLVPDEAIHAFLAHCAKRLGDAYFRTPREVTKAFLNLLDVLEQNPGTTWESQLVRVEIERPGIPDPAATADTEHPDEAAPPPENDDELTRFRL